MDKTHCYCFDIEPIILFKNESRFPFLKTKNTANLLLYKRNVIAKKVQSLTNQNTAIERYETKQLNPSILDEVVDKRYHGFS